jgi:phosphoribosyl-AMP cyclohydrolase
MDIDQEALARAFDAFESEESLLPVIVQEDESKAVLMLAYLNREALRLTVESGRATYFSRSRKSIWVKGESSGNRQWIRSIALDCDSDAVLFTVHQEGVACHTGQRSCFHDRLG